MPCWCCAVRLVPQQGHQSPLWTKAPAAKPVSLQAAAAGSAVASPEAGSTLIGRLRGLGKGLAISIPAAAISTVTGGALAGSLHAVTGERGSQRRPDPVAWRVEAG